ncbi:MAG: sulfite exporter TauE/SafE family protein [Bacteroidota bacterium]
MVDSFSMDLSLGSWILFLIAGVVTGVINTLAGSGSLITLPIFNLICGLPLTVANGTNRIGALIQSGVGLYSLHRTGQFSGKGAAWLVGAALLGAILGANLAVSLDETMMNYTIAGLMIFMLAVLLVNPKQWIRESEASAEGNRSLKNLIIFFLIGAYGGFIQAGVGVFLLAGLVLSAKYSLKAANGVKLLIVFCFSIPALYIFLSQGMVHWGFGLSMAASQSVGAVLAVRWLSKVPQANVWIHRLLILIVIAAALKYLGVYSWIGGMM